MARQYYKDTTTGDMKPLGVKVEDTLPVGTQIDFNGNNIPEGWKEIEDTGSVIVSSTEPTGNDRKKVWLQHGKNLLDTANIIGGLYSIGAGTYSYDESKRCTANMIQIDNTKNYILSTGLSSTSIYMYVMYYDTNKTYLGYTGGTVDNTLSLNTYSNYSNAKYINIRFDTTNLTQVMLEVGNTATTYEEYTAKTYILDDDNMYRKYAPQNEIYSTEETRIGTYLGKPLYRKVIHDTRSITAGTTHDFSIDISNLNIDELVDYNSKLKLILSDGYQYQNTIFNPNNQTNIYSNLEDYHSYVNVRTSTKSIHSIIRWTSSRDVTFRYILEYTKTTD